MKKILVVEDSENWQDEYADSLDGRVTIIPALTIVDIERLFLANPDIDLIVTKTFVGDYCMRSFIERARKTFKGPMIAVASCSVHRRAMIKAGCNHWVSHRSDVVEKVEEILGL